jgi:hypothetical protein
VPAHLSAEGSHPTTVLEFGRRQNSPADLHHVVADGQTELLHVGVVVEVRSSDQIVNFTFSVRSRSEYETMEQCDDVKTRLSLVITLLLL